MSSPRIIRWTVLLLVLLTLLLLGWQHFGMDTTLRIDANSRHSISTQDDTAQGGKSSSSVSNDGQRLVWNCQLQSGAPQPSCGLQVDLAKAPRGFDFSRFDKVAMKVGRQGEGSARLRLSLANFERGASDPADTGSWRPNELPFEAAEDGREIVVPLSNAKVADSWLVAKRVPLELSAIDISNVPAALLSLAGEGKHTISVDYIEFRGKLLSRSQVTMLALLAWMVAGVIYLIVELRVIRRQLQLAQQHEVRMNELNRTLQIDTQAQAAPRRDGLTGMRNRYGMRDDLLRELDRAQREGSPLSVVSCDLDHLENINHAHGEITGDKVLVDFAQTIARRVRATDLVVRWSGDEFILFCPDTAYESALALGEKLRSVVESHNWPNGLRVTASFGVATLQGNEPIADCLTRADAALYAAKQKGRNRTEGVVPGER